MRLAARLLGVRFPTFLKQRALRRLADLTAEALGRPAPSFAGRSYAERLAEYARFTSAEVSGALERGEDLRDTEARLHAGGYRLGARYRRLFRVATTREAMEVATLLYRALGIELGHPAAGRIAVTRCYFAGFYSAATCRVVSSLDAGFLAGLTGGGRLVFTRRITEGADSCEGCFLPAEAPG